MALSDEKIVEIHKNILYPVVRVRSEKAGGSGILLYSKPVPGNPEVNESLIATCFHVVEDAVKFIKKWSPIAQREITVEDKQLVQVEVFKYEKLSRCIGGTTYQAEIMAWDKELDYAILKLRTEERFPYVAKLYPRGKEADMKLGRETIASGCSLGHEPIFNFGNLVSKHDMIANKEYWMTTANTIFGNSGGPVFTTDTYEYIGNSAMISGIQLGFGIDIITWMGFFIPMEGVYKFFDEQFLQFIYDPNFTSKQCEEMRRKKMEEEEKRLILPEFTPKPAGSEKKY